MPFKSQAQRRWMYATHPEMAKEWEADTPKGRKLPDYVDPRHSHPFSFDPSMKGKCLICGKKKSVHRIK